MKATNATLAISALSLTFIANGSQAQPYGSGRPQMGPAIPPPGYLEPYGVRDPREGKIQAQTFVASTPGASALGHGPIVVAAAPNRPEAGFDGAYEAALVDQLAKAGYQPSPGAIAAGQTIEFTVTRELVQPPEPPHNPVTGGMALGASNRGSGFGLGLSIDLSKPMKALIATRLEVSIRDTATHELLWQGRAEVLAREGDKHWTDPAIAQRLSAALFKSFPRPI